MSEPLYFGPPKRLSLKREPRTDDFFDEHPDPFPWKLTLTTGGRLGFSTFERAIAHLELMLTRAARSGASQPKGSLAGTPRPEAGSGMPAEGRAARVTDYAAPMAPYFDEACS